jgi:hypothetical protein
VEWQNSVDETASLYESGSGPIRGAEYPTIFLSVNGPRRTFVCEPVGACKTGKIDPADESNQRIALSAGVSSQIGWPLFATLAGAKSSQIVIRVNARAVTVVPPEFDGVVTDSADLL